MLNGSSTPQGRWGAGTVALVSGGQGTGGGSGSPPTWLPAPPSSYSTSGTVALSSGFSTTAGIYPLFHPTWQKTVRNSGGTFVVFSSADNGQHTTSSWQMWRCPSGSDFSVSGNWTKLWDSNTKGDPQYGISPAIETDQNDNVYVIANYLLQSGSGFNGVKMYKFTKASGYAAPSAPVTLSSGGLSSGKWATFLDQGRSWIWVMHWSFGSNATNLMAFDFNGTQVYARNIFKPFTRKWSPTATGLTDLYGPSAHYPSICVGIDGTVYLAWATQACENNDFTGAATSFYDVRMVYSTATMTGSETWLGPTNGVSGDATARTIPFCTDDSSSSLIERGYQIVKTSNQDEYIPATNVNYGFTATGAKFNYNRLMGFTVNNSCAHFLYENDITNTHVIDHRSYARWRKSSFDISDSERRTPEFKNDVTSSGDNLGVRGGQFGNFAQDTTQASRLYMIQNTKPDSNHTFRILYSDDGGVGWKVYATSPSVPGAGSNGLLEPQLYRWVGSDGVIAGVVGLADSPNTVYAFTVTPN